MAVRQWELQSEQVRVTPRLALVPAPPPGGRVIPALLFVTLLVGLLAFPSVRAATKAPPRVIYENPRLLPASQIGTLDGITGMTDATRPVSSEPLGGILFVSCTNLWTALPDGSRARKLLAFPEISSPSYAPDARTIAFVGPGRDGPAIFMVAADGSQLLKLGDLRNQGAAVDARVSNMSWSSSGKRLTFALVDPGFDVWGEGSSIWSLDVASGEFKRVGGGSPSPAFVGNGIAFSSDPRSVSETSGTKFRSPDSRSSYMTKKLSTSTDDLTFAVTPGGFSDALATDHGVVVLHATQRGDLELVTKRDAWHSKIKDTYAAPSPYRFVGTGRLSIAQDGSRALVDLVDPKGDRAMGLLDLRSGDWTIRDYSWSGIATPAPTYTGPVGAQRARRLANDYFSGRHQNGAYSSAAILVGDREDDLITGARRGHVLGRPVRTGAGWSVPATIYARSDGRYRFQHAVLDLDKTPDGRVAGTARAVSPEYPLETIEDAKRFLSETVGSEIDFVWPTYLPEGVELDPEWAVDAYSYDDQMVATIHMVLPDVPGEPRDRRMSIAYGDVDFGLGCGGEINPEEMLIGDGTGLFDQTGEGPRHTRQILWPGTLDARDVGRYSVYGQMPRKELEAIAGSMASQG